MKCIGDNIRYSLIHAKMVANAIQLFTVTKENNGVGKGYNANGLMVIF